MNAATISAFIDENCPGMDKSARRNFSAWLKTLVDSAPMSSNIPSHNLPFQRWYRFKEAFSPMMVAESLNYLGFWPTTCLDCFGGSGTTALTCQFLGIDSTTIEVNPFLADLIEAKLAKYDHQQLVDDYAEVVRKMTGRSANLRSLRHESWPATMVEPGLKERWIFPRETFRQILTIREAIEEVESPINQRLLRVILGSILVDVSNVVISGKGRRYRSNWQATQKSPHDVTDAFKTAFQAALFDISAYGTRATHSYSLLRGDSRVEVDRVGIIDVALFSPPYPNSFDYTDIYNVELWVLGYLKSRADNTELRYSTLRSHVQVHRDMTWEGLDSRKLRKTVAALSKKRDELWDPHLPDMIGAYFADLVQILKSIRGRINPDGAVLMTVGDSRYANVLVDVGEILRELAGGAGYVCEAVTPIRAMKTSAQQGWEASLSEDLVRLRPV
ncbi:SAM-dependent methyltransferase [Burkholderia alba]|uniref:SAM-dependent methyltransferase n=1 Tax=Burkholderia alba TaxID=2683677 RepID=UPI002B059BF5|nr:SAM-dependent methyltransferase [Burkholderia alba]